MASKRSSGARSGGARGKSTRSSRVVAETNANTAETAQLDVTLDDAGSAPDGYDRDAVVAAGERAKAYAEARAEFDPEEDAAPETGSGADAAAADEPKPTGAPKITGSKRAERAPTAEAPRPAAAPTSKAAPPPAQGAGDASGETSGEASAKSSGGFASGLIGALVGAAAAGGALVFLAPGLLQQPAVDAPLSEELAALQARAVENAERIEDLDAEIDARVGALGQSLVDPAPMVNELADAIEAEMLAARDQRFALNERLQATGERLTAVESGLRESARALQTEIARIEAAPGSAAASVAAAGSAPSAPAATPDAEGLAALEAAAAQIAALQNDVSDLATRLAAAETGAAGAGPAQGDLAAATQTAVDAAIAPAIGRVDALETNVAASLARIDETLAAQTEAIASAATTAQTAEASLTALQAESADARATVEARVAALEAAENTPLADAAVGVALSAVSQAVATTGPYAVELDILGAAAGVEIPAPLAAGADAGLPSAVALATSFVDASRAGLAAAAKLSADEAAEQGDYLSALGGRLSQIIVVRRTEGVAGDAPTAVISRAQQLLDAGDVGGAIREIETLPVEAQIPMADWIERARLRADAEAALAALRAQLLTGAQ